MEHDLEKIKKSNDCSGNSLHLGELKEIEKLSIYTSPGSKRMEVNTTERLRSVQC